MLVERFWSAITYVVSIFTLSNVEVIGKEPQVPLHEIPTVVSQYSAKGPIFKPPTGDVDSNFQCEYPEMTDWESCSTETNRTCWLKNTKTSVTYDITTNYEKSYPKGIHRTYYLNITDGEYNGDGIVFEAAKLFNNTYPGPWLQACWGDTVSIVVTNKLKHNGTSVHWHGIRQLNNAHMDGVNGVTECPIAPGYTYTYTWKVMQYGSSWFHSHYSANHKEYVAIFTTTRPQAEFDVNRQYADGAVAPMTLHGPSSGNYDEAIRPTLMTDWGHNSAFEAIWSTLEDRSILLDGKGNVTRWNNTVKATASIPDPYELDFQPPKIVSGVRQFKRYLLRLINTSFDSTFVFSIDNHLLTVISADFVPIKPYTNASVLVGIGQRYHVIVEANPVSMDNKTLAFPDNGDYSKWNFWIRTWKANCFRYQNPDPTLPYPKPNETHPWLYPACNPNATFCSYLGYERAGILRYDSTSKDSPKSSNWPLNKGLPYNVSLDCSDETYESLEPILPWTVGRSVNNPTDKVGEDLSVHINIGPNKTPAFKEDIFPLALFSMGGDTFNPLQVDYGDPTILHLDYPGPWNARRVIYAENYTEKEWVYFVLKGKKGLTSGAHPIHLHGHDFAIMQQIENATYPNKLSLKWQNPPRRDVVLLPTNGYVIIAFKADNPGPWLMHCHIADHASFGLAIQVMERQKDAYYLWPNTTDSPELLEIQRTCNAWNKWWGDCANWWNDGKVDVCDLGEKAFGGDSGI